MKRKFFLFVALLTTTLIVMCACNKKEAVAVMTADGERLADTVEDSVSAEPADTVEDSVSAEPAGEEALTEAQDTVNDKAAGLLVHICGAVSNPGVYELAEGDRICHAVEKAGGFTPQADQNYLNQAQKLTDGMRIYIPTREETALVADDNLLLSGNSQQVQEGSGLININTATLEQLCSLPGIGEGKAQNIIAYREEKGSYASIEEIMNVDGIKEGLFEKIRDRITVS